MQELGRMIKEDPNLCAMTMVDKRKYIISKWNASHSAVSYTHLDVYKRQI